MIVHSSGDWDVRWGYGVLTHSQFATTTRCRVGIEHPGATFLALRGGETLGKQVHHVPQGWCKSAEALPFRAKSTRASLFQPKPQSTLHFDRGPEQHVRYAILLI